MENEANKWRIFNGLVTRTFTQRPERSASLFNQPATPRWLLARRKRTTDPRTN